jgi:hypothetical protein
MEPASFWMFNSIFLSFLLKTLTPYYISPAAFLSDSGYGPSRQFSQAVVGGHFHIRLALLYDTFGTPKHGMNY